MIITINLYMNHYVHKDDNDEVEIHNIRSSEILISYTCIKRKMKLELFYMGYHTQILILKVIDTI